MNENEQGKLLVAEVALELGRSTSGIKRLADELRLDVQRTGNKTRIFTPEHVVKLRAEIERREREGGRR